MTDSLRAMGSYFLGPHFYQSWKLFEGSPFEIGERFSTENPHDFAQRMLGLLDVVLNLDIPEQRFARLIEEMAVTYSPAPDSPTHRDLMEETRAGMASILAKQLSDEGDQSTESKQFIKSSLFDLYFYDGWESFGVGPFEIGLRCCSDPAIETGERMAGVVAALIESDLPESRFSSLCDQVGLNYANIGGMPSRSDVLRETRRGMLMVLSERTLKALDGEGTV